MNAGAARVRSSPKWRACHVEGWFTPLAEVSAYLANGWRVLDQLIDDPLGAAGVLLAPPAEKREAM